MWDRLKFQCLDLLCICCRQNNSTNPQQIEVMEFMPYAFHYAAVSGRHTAESVYSVRLYAFSRRLLLAIVCTSTKREIGLRNICRHH